MAGRHSEVITQLLRHVTSSPHNADVKGDILRHTIYPPSLVAVAFILGSLRFATAKSYYGDLERKLTYGDVITRVVIRLSSRSRVVCYGKVTSSP